MRTSLPVLVLLCLGIARPVHAQTPPSTDIYLVTLSEDGVSAPAPVTNRDGYDNQPHFTADGSSILYTSRWGDQTEIYRYNLAQKMSAKVTDTPESEYSPTPLPDGSGFSVIRVEADGTQRLWKFDNDGGNPSLVFEEIAPVGYHAWVDDHRVAMFILGNPLTLQLGDTQPGTATVQDRRIGRSIHRIPGEEGISYVSKKEEPWMIRRLDANAQSTKAIVPTLEGSEDYAWHPDGLIYMGKGSALYRWHPSDTAWTLVAEMSEQGISGITRLAISPDGTHLAFVASH